MASQPDTPNQEADRRRKELAALALLLRSSKKRYDLTSLIAQAKVRPRAFRPIRPTNALASNMAAPHFAIVNAWSGALPEIASAAPFGQSAVSSAIERASSRIAPTVLHAKMLIPRAVSLVEGFHRKAWVSRIKAATGLDVSMLTNASDVRDVTAATTAWNNALADDINAQIRTKLTANGLTGEFDPAEAKDVIKKARKRAAGIGADQVVKASRGMDRERSAAAGLSQFLWLHTPQPHPRDWHLARNGKTFGEGDIPADDRAGVPPFCKCYELPLLQ